MKCVHLLYYIWLPKWLWFLFNKPLPSTKHFTKTILSFLWELSWLLAYDLWHYGTHCPTFSLIFIVLHCFLILYLLRSSEFSLTLNLCNCSMFLSSLPLTLLLFVSVELSGALCNFSKVSLHALTPEFFFCHCLYSKDPPLCLLDLLLFSRMDSHVTLSSLSSLPSGSHHISCDPNQSQNIKCSARLSQHTASPTYLQPNQNHELSLPTLLTSWADSTHTEHYP